MIRAFAGGLLAFVLLAAPLWPGMAFSAPTFPPLTGRVVDQANILSPKVEADLTEKLQAVEQTTQHQFVVATIRDLQGYEIEDYGYQLGRAWKIGDAQRDDGVLLIVAPSARKVRIEVGYGLEPILTDALSSQIIQRAIIPHFKDGEMEEGVEAGVEAIAEQLALPDDQAQAVAQNAEPRTQSGGGGFPVAAIIIVIVVLSLFGSIAGRGRRYRRSGLGEALPWIVLGALANSRSRGGWSGGGGGGGWSGGGGGFSGGGGSFGGGGASGGW